MTPRVTNLSVLVLLTVAGLSGVASFLVGEPSGQWVFWSHRVSAFALLPLLPWKGRVVAASFRRRGGGLWALLPVLLSLLFLGSLATGLLWSTTGFPGVSLPGGLRVSGLTLHVAMAIAMTPFLVQHLVRRRPRPPRVLSTERRAFARQIGLLAIGGAVWPLSEVASRLLSLSGAERRFTGSREGGSFEGNAHPVTNWLTDDQQHIDVRAWSLRISGAVERVLELGYDDMVGQGDERHRGVESDPRPRAGSPNHVRAVLDCTGGWYTEQHWSGVSVLALLERAAPHASARSLVVRSTTGYQRRFPLADAARILLATHVEGAPLDESHGYPVRLVAPGYRGFEWVKWVTAIEVSERPAWAQSPLPLQ